MAAMGAMNMAHGMGNLERDAEDRHYTDGPTSKSVAAEDVATHGPTLAYSRAYFNPRIVLVFLMAVAIPTIYIYLYVGAVWNPTGRLHLLPVHILNLDQGIDRAALIAQYGLNATGVAALALLLPVDNIGLSLSTTLLTSPSSADLFSWKYYDASNSSLQSEQEVSDQVYRGDGDQWFTLVMPQNYTATFVQQAINVYDLSQLNDDFTALTASGQLPSPLNGSYNNPIYTIYDQGRSYATIGFINTPLTALLNGLASTTTATVYADISRLPAGTSYLKASFLLAPVPIVSVNTHPVPYYGMNFFTYLAGLVLWIGSMITLTIVVKYTMGVETKFFQSVRADTTLSVVFVMAVRVIMLSAIALVQAATVMSVLPAYGAEPHIAYGKGAVFVWLWYNAFVYVSVLGSLLALVGPDVFQIPSTLWLILQLTSSGAFMDNTIQPGFYKVRQALHSERSRTARPQRPHRADPTSACLPVCVAPCRVSDRGGVSAVLHGARAAYAAVRFVLPYRAGRAGAVRLGGVVAAGHRRGRHPQDGGPLARAEGERSGARAQGHLGLLCQQPAHPAAQLPPPTRGRQQARPQRLTQHAHAGAARGGDGGAQGRGGAEGRTDGQR